MSEAPIDEPVTDDAEVLVDPGAHALRDPQAVSERLSDEADLLEQSEPIDEDDEDYPHDE